MRARVRAREKREKSGSDASKSGVMSYGHD